MDPAGLIKFYNALVSLMVEGKFRPSYGRRGGFKRFTEKNLDTAADLLKWIGEHDWEPRPFLAGCFASHNWCYQPKLERLKSDKRYQTAYEDGTAWQWWEILQREDRFAEKPEGLHPGHEIVKARSFYEEQISPVLGSSGWHCFYSRLAGRFVAESDFCQRCDYKEICK